MTRNTPGIALAALVSIDLMRPCGTVLRNTLPCSMPGSRIRCVYSARPVTFSRASRRGTERPICPPPIGFVDIGCSAPVILDRLNADTFAHLSPEGRGRATPDLIGGSEG